MGYRFVSSIKKALMRTKVATNRLAICPLTFFGQQSDDYLSTEKYT